MLKQLLDLWYVRLEVVAETEASRQQARTMLILDQAGRIPYLQHNRQAEQLEIKTDRDPLDPGSGAPSVYHPPLSRGQEAILANPGRDCPDDVGGGNAHPRSRPRLESAGAALPQQSMPSSGDEHAPRAHGSLSAGEAGAADGIEGLSGPCNSAIGATIAAPTRVDRLLRTLLPDPSAPYARGHDDAVWQCLRELLGEPDDQDPDVAAARRLALQPARLAPSVDSGSMCGARRSCRLRGCMGRRFACIAAAPS